METFRISLLLFLVLQISTVSVVGQDQLCEVSFSTCPENFNNDTIHVPQQVVALSSKILACDPTDVIEGVLESSGPPSIMFVIDHSYSMMGLGNTYPGNDTYGSRFNVTRDLIDTIYSLYPDAEVGLVVFREVLYFDHRNNSLFQTLTGQGDQSYLPLLKLNSTIKGSTNGLQAIRNILKTDTVTEYNRYIGDPFPVECVDLVYKPQFTTVGNTNINNAFAAALQAMSKSSYPPERRFIIFLSDGEPYPITPTSKMDQDSIYRQHGGKEPFYFQQGLNTPTTFTVYLHNTDTVPPASLRNMTSNIRINNYSTSNKASEIWTLKTNYDALMSLFMKRIITPMLTVTTGSATSIVVNKVISTNTDQNGFIFSERFPLSPELTKFDISINYHLKNLRTSVESDTQVHTVIHIIRDGNAQLPEGIVSTCWEKAKMALYYQGQEVKVVNETMDSLQIRFFTGDVNYQKVVVTVSNQAGPVKDNENYTLNNDLQFWSKSFLRQTSTIVKNDNILQHLSSDSIILLYRNPQIPLDSIRIAVPYIISKNLIISDAEYNDRNADGFVDSIYIGVSGKLSNSDIEQIVPTLNLPAFRNFTIDSVTQAPGGFACYVKELGVEPITSTTSKDVITVTGKTLSGGGVLQNSVVSIKDNVAPVINSAMLLTSGSLYDSIRVIFSEPVKEFSSQKPFFFSTSDGKVFDVFLKQDGIFGVNSYSSQIANVQTGFSVEQNDSVWINPAASVSDSLLNIQNNPKNRRVILSVKQIPYTVTPSVINNPFTPGAKIPVQVENAYAEAGFSSKLDLKNGGMVLVVEPEIPLRPHVRLSGTVTIYDVVKNKIVENEPMVFDKQNQHLYFFWNGQNSKGRLVGTGTYMAVLDILDSQDLRESRSIRIGVKR